MAELLIEKLSLRFGEVIVLDKISFVLEVGELFALIGPSGAGKTSVLNCISGFYRGHGRINFRGEDIVGRAPHDVARLGVSRTFQNNELFPRMTVLENLLMGRHAHIRTNPVAEMLFVPSVRHEEVRQREAAERILEFAELERYRHAPVTGLPLGMQKLVGVARALALEPTLLMLDEPSGGLNRDEYEAVARFILRIKHELGITMLWAEHDIQLVDKLANWIHVLNYGRTLAEGAPAEIGNDPRVCDVLAGRAITGI
jgi:branched-chain amino acid transport system ATP-binding protein